MTATNIEKYSAMTCVVAEIIREMKQVPAGHLYALLIAFMTISEFELVIRVLIETRFISRKDHMITYIEKI